MSDVDETDGGSTEKTSEEPKQERNEFPYRIDWYQTDTNVVVTVFKKKDALNEKYDVTFSDQTLKITTSAEDGSHTRAVHLEKSIDPSRSTWVVLPSKIEIKMRKTESSKWTNYEAKKEPPPERPKGKNWDELVNKIEEEKLEGDALLNKFFGDIYEKGSDEVKKAMIKSFYESGGTELNTDWENVSKRNVEVKPPEGMEWKPWNK